MDKSKFRFVGVASNPNWRVDEFVLAYSEQQARLLVCKRLCAKWQRTNVVLGDGVSVSPITETPQPVEPARADTPAIRQLSLLR